MLGVVWDAGGTTDTLVPERPTAALPIAGTPVVSHTVDALAAHLDQVVLATDDPTVARHAATTQVEATTDAVRVHADDHDAVLAVSGAAYLHEGLVADLADGTRSEAAFAGDVVARVTSTDALVDGGVPALLDPETIPDGAARSDRIQDVRRPWDVLTATEHAVSAVSRALHGDVHADATCRGPVVVEEGAWVDAGVVLEGPVVVSAGARVGPNAYIRPNTFLGVNAHVGHGVEVKNSVLYESATVPHLTYVGDSVLGTDANLGAGSLVANLRHDGEPVTATHGGRRVSTGRRKFGAVVGRNARLGIGTQVNAGVTIAPGATTAPGETVLRDCAGGAE